MERIIGRNGGEGATPVEVASWLYGNARSTSPAQNAAEARFVEQMGRYGAMGSRLLGAPGTNAPAQ